VHDKNLCSPSPRVLSLFLWIGKVYGRPTILFCFSNSAVSTLLPFCCAHASSPSMPSFRLLCLFYQPSVVWCQGGFRCQDGKVSFHALNNAANRIHATRRLVSTHIVWSFLARDMVNWFHDCHMCHHENVSKQSAAPLQPFPVPARPMCIWTLVEHLTALEEGYVFLLTITYCSTRWVKAILLKNMERPPVWNILCRGGWHISACQPQLLRTKENSLSQLPGLASARSCG
jgi:hypothetical protein